MQLYGGHGGSVSEDGTETPSTLTLPLSTATKFGDAKEQKTISYKNSNDVKKPEALKKAFLEADGNGILNAYWTPAEVEVGEEDVDGYIITLYQKDDNGKYVDTGRGYTIPQERLTRVHEAVIMGQPVTDDSLGWEQRSDPDNPDQRITLYKLKMALAADGEMGKELSFGKDYKIGVCAYKRGNNLDDEVSELTTTCRQITSEETVSNAETLRKPDPFVFDIAADSGKVELGEDGRYRYRANLSKGRNLIIKNVRSVEGDDYDDSEDYLDAYYVSVDPKTGRVSEELLESGVIYPEDETSGEETKKLCKYWYKLPDENGSLQIKIVAKHLARTEGERRYYDETVQYVFVENDNVAPTLGITENEFIADDETGLYVVSGVADSDAFIYVNNEKKGQAKADGTFSVSSTLNRVGSAYVSICAKDQYDNESEDVIIKVSRITMPGGGGNISGGGGGGYSGGGSDKPEDTKPEDTTDIDDQNTPLDETPDSDSKTIEKKLNNGVKLVFAIKKNTLELLSVSKNATKLTIPASVTAKTGKKYKVTAISSKALQKLKKLTNVTFPKGIKKLPKKMLKGDSKLKYITFKGKLVTVPKGTFNGIYKKAIITIQNVTKKEYNSTKKLIVKSGVGKYVTIRRK